MLLSYKTRVSRFPITGLTFQASTSLLACSSRSPDGSIAFLKQSGAILGTFKVDGQVDELFGFDTTGVHLFARQGPYLLRIAYGAPPVIQTLGPFNRAGFTCAISVREPKLALISGGKLTVFDTTRLSIISEMNVESSMVLFLPDSDELVLSGNALDAGVYDSKRLKLIRPFKKFFGVIEGYNQHAGSFVERVCYSRDSSLAVVHRQMGDLMLWNPTSAEFVGFLESGDRHPRSRYYYEPRFSPDDELVACGDEWGYIRIYCTKSRKLAHLLNVPRFLRTLRAFAPMWNRLVIQSCWHPSQALFAVGTNEGDVLLCSER